MTNLIPFKNLKSQRSVNVWYSFIAAGGIGLYIASSIPETFGLKNYIKLFQKYNSEGNEEELTDELKGIVDKLTIEYDLHPADIVDMKVFFTSTMNPINKGNIESRFGAIFGIPATFKFTTVDEVKNSNLKVAMEKINWSSKEGESLAESLVLSTEAKAYAIAREISYAMGNSVVFLSLSKMVSYLLAYATGSQLNVIFNLKARLPRFARVGMYTLVSSFYLVFYLSVHDFYNCYSDRRADKKASQLHSNLAKGGIEYYDKLLQRNSALRILLRKEGEAYYSFFGNEKQSVRKSQLTLTEKRDIVRKTLESFDYENDLKIRNNARLRRKENLWSNLKL